jgi:unsaturated chondroitin disaccharide hydrolase
MRHSNTTLKHFIREDGSVYHSFRFHPDGTPQGPDNFCGRAVDSHWARGAAWAMYGFALGYRHTKDIHFLDASLRVTRKWIALLDSEMVPVWDFQLPEGEEMLRDSSAAAIAICAIQELSGLGHADKEMIKIKDALLARLCTNDYLDTSPDTRGILKRGEVGDGVGKARYAYTSWGDYFFMEGLAREIGLKVSWW